MARKKLNLDWDSLFPGDVLKIGNEQIVIKPLGMLSLATIAKQVKGFGAIVSAEGVTWDNYHQPENLVLVAATLLDKFPEVLAEVSDIDPEDLARLPLDYIVKILDKVLEVNLKSRDDLEKNFLSLAAKFQKALPNQK